MYNLIPEFYSEISQYGNIASLATYANAYSIAWNSASTSDYICYKLGKSYFANKNVTFGYAAQSANNGAGFYFLIRAYKADDVSYTSIATLRPNQMPDNKYTFDVPSDCVTLRIYVRSENISQASDFSISDLYLTSTVTGSKNILTPFTGDLDFYGASEANTSVLGPWSIQIDAQSSADWFKAKFSIASYFAGKTLYLGWKQLGYNSTNKTKFEVHYLDSVSADHELLVLTDSSVVTNEERTLNVPADATQLYIKLVNSSGVTYPNVMSVENLYISDASQVPTLTITQPESLVVISGEITQSLTASATASDESTVTYKWYSNTTQSNVGGTAIEGATTNTFAIPSLLTNGVYYYYCTFETETVAETPSQVATITVRGSTPKIIVNKVNATNLPESVEPGTEAWYFVPNSVTGNIDFYIAAEDGSLKPVGSSTGSTPTPEAGYYNAYMEAAINERIDEIKALQIGNTITFAVATDIHLRTSDFQTTDRDNRHNRICDFIMLDAAIPLDYICITGDLIASYEIFSAFEPRLKFISDNLRTVRAKVYTTRGNHDLNTDNAPEETGLTQSTVISNKVWYDSIEHALQDSVDAKVIKNPACPKRTHYYVDDYVNKHRLIFINTYDHQVNADGTPYLAADGDPNVSILINTTEQLTWLLDEALDMTGKTDWIVSFFGHHIPYLGISGSESFQEFHGYGNYSNTYLYDVLTAFINGTDLVNYAYPCQKNDGTWASDPQTINKAFSTQGPIATVGFFGGHIHDDCYYKLGSLNEFVSTCTCANRRTSWGDTDPDPVKLPPIRSTDSTAMSINVFIINKTTKTVNVIKIGSKRDQTIKTSSDYEFTYGS